MLTVRVPDELLADRLRRLDTLGHVHVVGSGPAGFVVATAAHPDADAVLDDPADLDSLWRRRLGPFAADLAEASTSSGPAVLSAYDPAWPLAAERRLARLRQVLDPGYDLQHIGSTSVPGLAAKAIIDLQVRVPVLPSMSTMDSLVRCLGYRPAAGANEDSPGVHRDIPRGTGSVPSEVWEKRLLVSPDPAEPAILHIRRADSPWGRYTVRFRDWLRANPVEAARYEHRKLALARAHADDPDYDNYTRAKTAFFDEIQPHLEGALTE